MRQNEIGQKFLLKLKKDLFDLRTAIWKETVSELVANNSPAVRPLQKQLGTAVCFATPGLVGGEHDPPNFQVGVLVQQSKHRSPASDLNIIAVSAETQQPLET